MFWIVCFHNASGRFRVRVRASSRQMAEKRARARSENAIFIDSVIEA